MLQTEHSETQDSTELPICCSSCWKSLTSSSELTPSPHESSSCCLFHSLSFDKPAIASLVLDSFKSQVNFPSRYSEAYVADVLSRSLFSPSIFCIPSAWGTEFILTVLSASIIQIALEKSVLFLCYSTEFLTIMKNLFEKHCPFVEILSVYYPSDWSWELFFSHKIILTLPSVVLSLLDGVIPKDQKSIISINQNIFDCSMIEAVDDISDSTLQCRRLFSKFSRLILPECGNLVNNIDFLSLFQLIKKGSLLTSEDHKLIITGSINHQSTRHPTLNVVNRALLAFFGISNVISSHSISHTTPAHRDVIYHVISSKFESKFISELIFNPNNESFIFPFQLNFFFFILRCSLMELRYTRSDAPSLQCPSRMPGMMWRAWLFRYTRTNHFIKTNEDREFFKFCRSVYSFLIGIYENLHLIGNNSSENFKSNQLSSIFDGNVEKVENFVKNDCFSRLPRCSRQLLILLANPKVDDLSNLTADLFDDVMNDINCAKAISDLLLEIFVAGRQSTVIHCRSLIGGMFLKYHISKISKFKNLNLNIELSGGFEFFNIHHRVLNFAALRIQKIDILFYCGTLTQGLPQNIQRLIQTIKSEEIPFLNNTIIHQLTNQENENLE
ncbi:hypothetical protein RCL1_000569 [Eukaryota sp. TZLM3-RCL]